MMAQMHAEIRRYRRGELIVEAVTVTRQNATLVADWCDGLIIEIWLPETWNEIHVSIMLSCGLDSVQGSAHLGDVVVRSEYGLFYAMSADDFFRDYTEMTS